MKRITITICASAILLFSCNDSKTSDAKTTTIDTSKADNVTPKTDATTTTPPMDSAAMMQAWMNYMTPGDVHKMIASWDGTWTEDITMWMAPGAPPTKSTATAVNKMILGGRYQETKVTGSFDGMPFEGRSLLGYDNAKKTFQSSWVDNMGTGIILMEGTMDSTTRAITLKGKGIDPSTGKEIDMRQTFVVLDENNQKMEMFCTKDGTESKTMEMIMKKK